MCGIIGYVGQRACKPLLLQGLERLEYRGYDSAGLRPARGGRARLRARGRQPPAAEAGLRVARVDLDHGRRPHALGDARRASRSRTRTRSPAATTPRSSIVLNGIVENYRELKESLVARGARVLVGDRRRGGRPPDRAPLRRRPRRRLPERLRAARGALLDRRHPPRPPGHPRRRALPDAARRRRRATARCSSHPRSPRSCTRRAACSSSTTTRSSSSRPEGAIFHGEDGEIVEPEVTEIDWDDESAEKSRLRDVHAQGDLRAARGGPRDDRRPRPRPAADPRGPRPHRARDPEPPPDRHRRLRHRVPRRRRRPLHPRGVGAPAGRARHRQRMDLPQPRADEGHARDRHLAVRARRATRSTR